jgi:hypothetical protein
MRARSLECAAAAVLFALVASNTERLHKRMDCGLLLVLVRWLTQPLVIA